MPNQRRQLDQRVSLAPQLDQSRQLDQQVSLDQQLDQPHRMDTLHGQKTPHSHSGQTSLPGESTSGNDQGSPDSPSEPPKVCYTCARSFPATQFRFRNKAKGVRMTECRACYNLRTKNWHRKKRAREKGWDIHKTASQIARSPDIARTAALLENLVAVMGGPEKLVEAWHNECWKLTSQKRSSTRLARMYEMLIVLMGQTQRAKLHRAAASPPKAAS